MQEAKRNNILDILKGLAIINIIFIHTVWWTGTEYVPDVVSHLALLVDVPLFFFLSGWASTINKKIVFNPFNRIIKLYVPYTIMLILLITLLFLFYGRKPSIHDFSGWFLFLNFNSHEIPVVLGSMWFLIVFLFVTLLTPILIKISQSNEKSFILMFVLSGISLLYSFNDTFLQLNLYPTVSLRVFSFYLLIYFSGIFFSKKHITFAQMIKLVISIVLFLGCFTVFQYDSSFNMQNNKFPPNTFYLLASLISIIIALYAKNFEDKVTQKIQHSRLLKFLKFSGENVFFVYLYQGFGSSFIGILVAYFRDLNLLEYWVPILIICFISNIIITYIMVVFAKGINNKISFIYKI